jgi:hypothetical protein
MMMNSDEMAVAYFKALRRRIFLVKIRNGMNLCLDERPLKSLSNGT